MTTSFNIQTGEVTQQGGVTRVTHYEAPSGPLETSSSESTTVGNSVQRITYRNGEMTSDSLGVTRHQEGIPDPTNTSVMATLKRVGGALTVELIPGQSGSRTVIKQAEKLGLIEYMGEGRYRDAKRSFNEAPAAPAAEPEQEQQQQERETSTPDEVFFNAEEDKAFAEAIEPLPQHAYNSAVALATVASLDGTDLSKVGERLSKEAGMDRDTAAQMVDSAYNMYRETVVRTMVPEGIQPEEASAFFDWCRSRPRELQNAIGQLTAARDLNGFRQLATLYRGTKRVNG